MAFNFAGTFSTGQFDSFRTFSKLQEQDLKRRISWLKADLLRVGVFSTQYDPETNLPVLFSVAPSNSYGAKLMLAYKILGGFPEMEMLLRTRDIPVFKVRGVPINNDQSDPDAGQSFEYSNGRRQRSGMRFDRDMCVKVDKIKNWQLEVIKRKRESLEYKIKKALDYSDQVSEEIKHLSSMVDPEGNNLDSFFMNARVLMFAAGTMNVVDNALDVFGLSIGSEVDPVVEGSWDSAPAVGGRK